MSVEDGVYIPPRFGRRPRSPCCPIPIVGFCARSSFNPFPGWFLPITTANYPERRQSETRPNHSGSRLPSQSSSLSRLSTKAISIKELFLLRFLDGESLRYRLPGAAAAPKFRTKKQRKYMRLALSFEYRTHIVICLVFCKHTSCLLDGF